MKEHTWLIEQRFYNGQTLKLSITFPEDIKFMKTGEEDYLGILQEASKYNIDEIRRVADVYNLPEDTIIFVLNSVTFLEPQPLLISPQEFNIKLSGLRERYVWAYKSLDGSILISIYKLAWISGPRDVTLLYYEIEPKSLGLRKLDISWIKNEYAIPLQEAEEIWNSEKIRGLRRNPKSPRSLRVYRNPRL